jgi:hypothetical protein
MKVNERKASGVSVNYPKAIIFSHFGKLQYGRNRDEFAKLKENYIELFRDRMEPYFICNSEENIISIVYIYIDWAIKHFVKSSKQILRQNKPWIDPEVLQQEQELIGILSTVEDNLIKKHPEIKAPKFHYIGIVKLIELFNNIIEVDKALVAYLSGPANIFGYDSPKFVEAIIRLARGNTPHLAIHPIIRIDEDVEPNDKSIRLLIDKYLNMCEKAPFFFFSGSYGNPDGKYDPLNDYAVRTHWFLPVGTRSGDPISQQNQKVIYTFLADLSELGAAQLNKSRNSYSHNLKELLKKRKEFFDMPVERSPQVISGAGLIMSHKAINLLPPFMNFDTLTTWVDDHLKRLLHEVVGDISPNALECVLNAKIKQNRYRDGIKQRDIDDLWGETSYFERLIRGCLFHRLISDANGNPTNYSKLIGDILKFQISENSERINKNSSKQLEREMIEHAKERYNDVIKCWQSQEFESTVSYEWARKRTSQDRIKACQKLVKDALNYIKLVLKWHIFVRAIQRLDFQASKWLFENL